MSFCVCPFACSICETIYVFMCQIGVSHNLFSFAWRFIFILTISALQILRKIGLQFIRFHNLYGHFLNILYRFTCHWTEQQTVVNKKKDRSTPAMSPVQCPWTPIWEPWLWRRAGWSGLSHNTNIEHRRKDDCQLKKAYSKNTCLIITVSTTNLIQISSAVHKLV
jgi:hypothetical protein